MPTEPRRVPRGYWTSVGVSIGIGISAALGVALQNIGIGIALGVAIGAGIGVALEQRHKDSTRALTEPEKKAQKWAVMLGSAILLILVGLSIVILLMESA